MICRLITYLYLGDYEPCESSKVSNLSQMKNHKAAAERSANPHVYSATDHCACLVRSEHTFSSNTERMQNQVATPLSIHADMYALGDKYQVTGLQHLAAMKFKASLAYHWDSPDFITAVQTVYSSTPDSNRVLRDIVVQAFKDHFGTDITKDPAIEAKLDTIDELAFALLKSWPKKAETPKADNTSTKTQQQAPPASPFRSTFGSSVINNLDGTPLFGGNIELSHNRFGSTPAIRPNSCNAFR
jgi:hypothetical protein